MVSGGGAKGQRPIDQSRATSTMGGADGGRAQATEWGRGPLRAGP